MLRNCVAIVSGGASGLGAATVNHIIRHGGKALVADLPHQHDTYLRLADEASAGAAKASLDSSNNSNNTAAPRGSLSLCHKDPYYQSPVIAFAEVDVRSEDMINRALDLAEKIFDSPVNACINCAGIAMSSPILSNNKTSKTTTTTTTTAESITEEENHLRNFLEHLQVNAVGTFNMARLSAERMIKRQPDAEGLRGCIVNTSSIAAYEGQTGQVGFAASKGAVVGMTLPLAMDLAPYGIRVMTIAPGIFKTPMMDQFSEEDQDRIKKSMPLGRFGYPDEYANLVVTILNNHMLNGEIIRIDGGFRMSKLKGK